MSDQLTHIVILQNGIQFWIHQEAAVQLGEKIIAGTKQWQTFRDDRDLLYMFNLEQVSAIVQENFIK